ncbi:MAG: ABC transporter ATP-binding protein [Proteobacteria bacterium]|nr:ABC transporter ATP-binding protein [Pseudomonadota bacterium]
MLAVEDLKIRIGNIDLLRGLSFTLGRGETLALVGESGSGKSLTALAIMGLLPPAMQVHGAIRLDGRDLLALDEPAYCALRGRKIAMVFQEPMTALNPVMNVGAQIAEVLIQHGLLDRQAALAEAARLLDRVGIADAATRLGSFPHELSGGQRQRVIIAMAIACQPTLLIADEPTSALDATVQVEIIELLAQIRAESGMGMLFITHDLGVVNRIADRVLVLYGGMAMEEGDAQDVIAAPRHPYTHGLIAAIPRGNARTRPLNPIPGQVPGAGRFPPGCAFFSRCPRATDLCRNVLPPLSEDGHRAWCHHVGRKWA